MHYEQNWEEIQKIDNEIRLSSMWLSTETLHCDSEDVCLNSEGMFHKCVYGVLQEKIRIRGK